MEAEYIALSQSCKSLFPLLDQIRELGSAVGLPVEEYTNMHVKIHEDNVGALTLGKLEPRRMTPRSKHYAIKYHWFREQIEPRKIKLVKIATKDQLGDMFTKGLGSVPFSYLRSKIMGW
jgi:alkyl hydroperoxide reductase subunit AhpF